jgi:hypothetical protein
MGSRFLLSANFSAGFGIVGVVPRDSLDANGLRIYDFMNRGAPVPRLGPINSLMHIDMGARAGGLR